MYRIIKDITILHAIQINHGLAFLYLPFPRRALNGKRYVFPPLLDMGVH